MQAFKITGGKPLTGTIEIMGAKNAVLPLMTAALLTAEPVVLKNVPFLSDVTNLIQLLDSFGCRVQRRCPILYPCSRTPSPTPRPLMNLYPKCGPVFGCWALCFPVFNKQSVSLPGGCAIGARPVDLYLMALRQMGAKIEIQNGYVIASGKLHGADIYFPKVSVGATHNTIMAAVLAKGVTRIYNPAFEPEVMDLIALLKKMGANLRVSAPKF